MRSVRRTVPQLGLVGMLVLCAACAAALPRAPIAPVNAAGGLALAGYDPVAYFTDGAALPGSDAHAAEWQGVTYRFASAAHRESFVARPAAYVPQYGGYCAYAIASGRIADIDPDDWAVVGGKLYLNNNALAQALWSLDRPGSIVAGDRNWPAVPKRQEAAPTRAASEPAEEGTE